MATGAEAVGEAVEVNETTTKAGEEATRDVAIVAAVVAREEASILITGLVAATKSERPTAKRRSELSSSSALSKLSARPRLAETPTTLPAPVTWTVPC